LQEQWHLQDCVRSKAEVVAMVAELRRGLASRTVEELAARTAMRARYVAAAQSTLHQMFKIVATGQGNALVQK
jgi:hypothetical protein